jgi:transcription initiation factor TFIID subunit 6
LAVLSTLREGRKNLANGHGAIVTDELRERLNAKVGDIIAGRIADAGEVQMAYAVLEA